MGAHSIAEETGSLGVGNMVIKNVGMLFKWWWQFFEGKHALWKRVMCSCNKLVLGRPIGEHLNSKGVGPWQAIYNVWKLNKEVEHVCRNGEIWSLKMWECCLNGGGSSSKVNMHYGRGLCALAISWCWVDQLGNI